MTVWSAREHHRFEAAGQPFVYLVPSAAIFALDPPSDAVLRALSDRPRTREELSDAVPDGQDLDAALTELLRVQAIGERSAPPTATAKVIPLAEIPLTTMVLNVTNQCNLSCTYCYEYGEDKIVDTENGRQPKFMTEETARQSVEFMLKESGDNTVAHITFFGGETLLNFPVLAKTIAYARRRGAELGKIVDFSLTTNATLLKPEIIEFLAAERVGVTISIDGPREVQDKFRETYRQLCLHYGGERWQKEIETLFHQVRREVIPLMEEAGLDHHSVQALCSRAERLVLTR